MRIAIRDSLRERRRTFTPTERAELVDELLAERYPPTPVPLSELWAKHREATQERDRLQWLGREALQKVAELDARCRDRVDAERNTARRAAIEAQYATWRAPHLEQADAAERAVAELAELIDWPSLDAAMDRFNAMVADALKAHQIKRLEVAERMVADRRAAFDAARKDATVELPYDDLKAALRKAADLEAELLTAERALQTVTASVKGKGRR